MEEFRRTQNPPKSSRLLPFPPTQTQIQTPNLHTMPHAQLILGPPGSGKSTYAHGMYQFLSALGRKCSVVNLDPANETTNYPCALDIRDFVRVEEVMEREGLGPNGGVLWSLEEVEGDVGPSEGGLGGENEEGGWLERGLRGLGGG